MFCVQRLASDYSIKCRFSRNWSNLFFARCESVWRSHATEVCRALNQDSSALNDHDLPTYFSAFSFCHLSSWKHSKIGVYYVLKSNNKLCVECQKFEKLLKMSTFDPILTASRRVSVLTADFRWQPSRLG
jgi:hypothetical protein